MPNFTFFSNWGDLFPRMSVEEKAQMLDALCAVARGEEPDAAALGGLAEFAWIAISPNVQNSVRNRDGNKGGRPPKKRAAEAAEAGTAKTGSTSETSVSDSENQGFHGGLEQAETTSETDKEKEKDRDREKDMDMEVDEAETSGGPDDPCGGEQIPYTEIVGYLNERTGQHYRDSTRETRKLIRARWAEGMRLPDFEAAIDNRSAAWSGSGEYARYLRPSTLFGPKMEGYANEIRPSPSRVGGAWSEDGSGEGWGDFA